MAITQIIDTYAKKPPLGLTPRWLERITRIENIKAAIKRYMFENLRIPIEWIKEYNDLIKEKNNG